MTTGRINQISFLVLANKQGGPIGPKSRNRPPSSSLVVNTLTCCQLPSFPSAVSELDYQRRHSRVLFSDARKRKPPRSHTGSVYAIRHLGQVSTLAVQHIAWSVNAPVARLATRRPDGETPASPTRFEPGSTYRKTGPTTRLPGQWDTHNHLLIYIKHDARKASHMGWFQISKPI